MNQMQYTLSRRNMPLPLVRLLEKKEKAIFFSITRILWNGIGLLKRKTPPCLYSYRLSLWKRFWSSANYLWYFMIRNSPFLGSNRQTQTCTKKNMKREPRRQKWWFLHYIEPRKRDLIYRTPLNWIYTWDLFFLAHVYIPTNQLKGVEKSTWNFSERKFAISTQ